jgi:hypothetical protein
MLNHIYPISETETGTKQDYLDLLQQDYEWVNIFAHGFPPVHIFADGEDTVLCWTDDILSVNRQMVFCLSYSCVTGLWTDSNNIATGYIYGNTSTLAIRAPTTGLVNQEGRWDVPNFLEPLKTRGTLGDGMVNCLNESVPWDMVLDDDPGSDYYGNFVFVDKVPIEFVTLLGDPTLKPKRRWFVKADGSGDVETIQDAIDEAGPFDLIYLESGTYTGSGNRDIDFKGKPILVSALDDADAIINCQDSGRGFYFHSGESQLARLQNITVINGDASGSSGGAVLCESGSSPLIAGCTFYDNEADYGGAVAVLDSAGPTARRCTIVENDANYGGGVYAASDNSTARIEYCVVASAAGGGGVYYSGSDSNLVSCSVVYGNTGGNWPGSIDLSSANDNIGSDPDFCDASSDDFTVSCSSPCVVTNNDCNEWIGSKELGCAYMCGDVTHDCAVDIDDISFLLAYIFDQGPTPDPFWTGDVDCSEPIDIDDVTHILAYVFSGGNAPCDIDGDGVPDCGE